MLKEQYGDSMRMKHGTGFSVSEARLASSSSALLEALHVALSYEGNCIVFPSFPEHHLRAWGTCVFRIAVSVTYQLIF